MVTNRVHVWIVSTVAILVSLLYFSIDPSVGRFFPPWPFHTRTGVFCPGCGTQRAFHDLLHGHWLEACHHNLLFVLFLPLVGYSAVVTVNNIFRQRKMSQPLFHYRWFAPLVGGVVVLFWGLRNIPVTPFNWLAPH